MTGAPPQPGSHWRRWHSEYDRPGSSLSRRLAVVRRRLAEALDGTPAGPVLLVSMCAGQGRDVIGVLETHPRRADVAARLVELDPELVAEARAAARRAGLHRVDVVEGDASDTSAYEGAVPASVVLVCGVFGNISAADTRRTVSELPRLCTHGATVIWTRHRRPPDRTTAIRAMFARSGFTEIAFDTEPGVAFGVGVHRFDGRPKPYRAGRRLFSFLGDGSAAHR